MFSKSKKEFNTEYIIGLLLVFCTISHSSHWSWTLNMNLLSLWRICGCEFRRWLLSWILISYRKSRLQIFARMSHKRLCSECGYEVLLVFGHTDLWCRSTFNSRTVYELYLPQEKWLIRRTIYDVAMITLYENFLSVTLILVFFLLSQAGHCNCEKCHWKFLHNFPRYIHCFES